jgi:hypothetical protein
MTPKALKLHLQSIKLKKSFYSSNFCYFTCVMMSRFAKFQVFCSSTILIPVLWLTMVKCWKHYWLCVAEVAVLQCRWKEFIMHTFIVFADDFPVDFDLRVIGADCWLLRCYSYPRWLDRWRARALFCHSRVGGLCPSIHWQVGLYVHLTRYM